MKRVVAGLFMVGALAAADTSSNVVASVSSSNAFALDGVTVPAKGVASWPVLSGDTITTSGGPAMVTLSDGTQMLIDPNSKVKIVSDGKNAKIEVVSGSARDWDDRDDRDGKKRHWCWPGSEAKTSHHKCGDHEHHNDHDADDRCCPVDRD